MFYMKLFSSPVEKEDLRRNYISLCDNVNEQACLNEMLKGNIKEFPKSFISLLGTNSNGLGR